MSSIFDKRLVAKSTTDRLRELTAGFGRGLGGCYNSVGMQSVSGALFKLRSFLANLNSDFNGGSLSVTSISGASCSDMEDNSS